SATTATNQRLPARRASAVGLQTSPGPRARDTGGYGEDILTSPPSQTQKYGLVGADRAARTGSKVGAIYLARLPCQREFRKSFPASAALPERGCFPAGEEPHVRGAFSS